MSIQFESKGARFGCILNGKGVGHFFKQLAGMRERILLCQNSLADALDQSQPVHIMSAYDPPVRPALSGLLMDVVSLRRRLNADKYSWVLFLTKSLYNYHARSWIQDLRIVEKNHVMRPLYQLATAG